MKLECIQHKQSQLSLVEAIGVQSARSLRPRSTAFLRQFPIMETQKSLMVLSCVGICLSLPVVFASRSMIWTCLNMFLDMCSLVDKVPGFRQCALRPLVSNCLLANVALDAEWPLKRLWPFQQMP